ncbi:acetylcholinesterase, partial [Fusarium albosuccineum]
MRVSNYLLPLAAALTQQVTAAPSSNEDSTCLPVVDLGYVSTFSTIPIPFPLLDRQAERKSTKELHRALWHNPDTDLYKFQNVRYGRSPTGDL